MNTRKILLAAVFLLPTLASGYMTWLTWTSGDGGRWLFGVFSLFFLLLAVALLAPQAKPQTQAESSAPTGFRPHWFMLLAAVVVVLTVILAIVGAILRS